MIHYLSFAGAVRDEKSTEQEEIMNVVFKDDIARQQEQLNRLAE